MVSHSVVAVNEYMKIEPKIFKAYDIRGLASNEITPEVAERTGRAVVKLTQADVVVVGRDMRKTSPELLKALIAGITAAGADVINIGLASTPLFYYAVGRQFEDEGNPSTSSGLGLAPSGAGIMVTASHNPKEYNGLKMERGNVLSIGAGSGMEEIKDMVMNAEFTDGPEGNVMEIDARQEYVDHHLEIVPRRDIGSPRIVLDAGNGMSGHVTPLILKAYGLDRKCKKLFFDPDGSFPNHEPNPVKPENLVWVIEAVKKEKADLGVAFDGDSDRVGFVDETGAIVRGDIMTALIATEVLRKYPGSSVVYNLVSSNVVKETIAAAGGKPVMSAVGHAFIKEMMHKTNACFAGEPSTHYFFKDFFYAESSDMAMLLALKIMKRTGKKLSELVAPLMKYFHSGEINFKINDKEGLMKKLEEKYSSLATDIIKIDGLRCEFGSWWFSVRASNTEPLVRLNVEAKSKEELDAKVGELTKMVESF